MTAPGAPVTARWTSMKATPVSKIVRILAKSCEAKRNTAAKAAREFNNAVSGILFGEPSLGAAKCRLRHDP
jgi:hypothetical protein